MALRLSVHPVRGTLTAALRDLRGTGLHVNVAFLHLREKPARPRFALVGERCIYGDQTCRLTREAIEAEGGWLLRHESGEAVVFERAEPPAPD